MENICIICNKKFKQLQNKKRRRCNACNTKIRRFRNKQRAILLLGGKCQRCGYDKHQAALEFHHKDPKQKDFAIGMVANKSWQSIVDEIKKCELLCSNCHRIEHSNKDDSVFLEEAFKYKGKVAEMD